MAEQRESNERERAQLQSDLADEREALLAVVSGVDEEALKWPTRNPGWALRDVLAHVLAGYADLISLIEAAARPSTRPLRPPTGPREHQQEMARWTDATAQALADGLRERGDRWLALLDALPDSALAMPFGTGARVTTLGDAVGAWRGHDREHAEDVRLALVDGRAHPSR